MIWPPSSRGGRGWRWNSHRVLWPKVRLRCAMTLRGTSQQHLSAFVWSNPRPSRTERSAQAVVVNGSFGEICTAGMGPALPLVNDHRTSVEQTVPVVACRLANSRWRLIPVTQTRRRFGMDDRSHRRCCHSRCRCELFPNDDAGACGDMTSVGVATCSCCRLSIRAWQRASIRIRGNGLSCTPHRRPSNRPPNKQGSIDRRGGQSLVVDAGD